MCAKHVKKTEPEVGTTGHSWDGIEELNNPLPLWWVWVFYATIVWGLWYIVAYPSIPLPGGATQGYTGQDSRLDVAAEIARFDAANAAIKAQLVAAPLTDIAKQDALNAYAKSAGASVFKTNCATCHGAGAAGVQGKGYPNLLDNDWLWGGDIEAIHTTITHGIRNATDADARFSQMPRFGVDGLLEPAQISQVVEYVLQISGQKHDVTRATAGQTLFADNCAACHADTGTGLRDMGSPNLTDAIWLYGGTREKITETVFYSRNAVMPAWSTRLSEDEIRAVAVYVHGLGGGE